MADCYYLKCRIITFCKHHCLHVQVDSQLPKLSHWIGFPAMCKESHHKLAESIRGMPLDFSVALFKGALLDGATSPLCFSGLRQKKGWG